MDILFADAALGTLCNSQKLAKKKWGAKAAKLLSRRLSDLKASANLFVMFSLPGRCHPLQREHAGRYALALDGGLRLVFEPANDPQPQTADGGLDARRVTAIRVVTVEDYHD